MIGQEKNANGPMVITNFSSLLWNIFFDKSKMDDQPKVQHTLRQRIAAAYFGCWALHFSLLVIYIGDLSLDLLSDLGLIFVFALVSGYSVPFALIVAFGSPEGTVIRHFAYGVLLPTLSYSTAGYLYFVIGG